MPEPDWAAIATSYVDGVQQDAGLVFPTREELAAAYHVDLGELERRDALEDWSAHRDANRHRQRIERRAAQLEANLDATDKFDQLGLGAARFAMAQVLERFKATQESKGLMPVSELGNLTIIAERAQRIGKAALELPTERLEEAERVDTQGVQWRQDTRVLLLRDVARGLPGPIAGELLRRAQDIHGPQDLVAVIQSTVQRLRRA